MNSSSLLEFIVVALLVVAGALAFTPIAAVIHAIMRRAWLFVPLALGPALYALAVKPEFSSLLWRCLFVTCVVLMVWSIVVGAPAIWRALSGGWWFSRGDGSSSNTSSSSASYGEHEYDYESAGGSSATSYGSEDAFDNPELTPEEALLIVLELEVRRLAAGYKPGWLYYQCRDNPILLKAFNFLRDAGSVGGEASSAGSGARSSGGSAGVRPETKRAQANPYDVLGLTSSASLEEIKSAYRDKMKRYHPDRLQHFGPEFAALANEKTKEIQAAYEELLKARGENR